MNKTKILTKIKKQNAKNTIQKPIAKTDKYECQKNKVKNYTEDYYCLYCGTTLTIVSFKTFRNKAKINHLFK